jgi:hypothetical protein
MKKIIKLTENELNALVKSIVIENIKENDLYMDIKELIFNSNSSHEETVDVLRSIADEMESSRRIRRDVGSRFRDSDNKREFEASISERYLKNKRNY